MEQQYDFGKCRFCGADNVRNPKTGNIFCGNKCWLNNQGTKFVKQGQELKVKEDPNVAIRQNMEIKAQGMAKGACFNKACDIAIALYSKGDITSDFILSKINELFTELSKINKYE